MSLMQQIPKEFYRVFRTKNREHYFTILVELYQANMEDCQMFELTKTACRDIINETMVKMQIVWQEDEQEQENVTGDGYETQMELRTPAARSLTNLINWGWLREDYDERFNEEIITFPEYSQMFVELFWQLGLDSDSQERESIMSIYSLLYTYRMDQDHNNEILKNAWKTSRRLTQYLTNMQDGMRNYFDRLSTQKNFLGIQEVLVQELNNSDSKRYAMLTTTDSFYRYKEQVKELISLILDQTEEQSLTYKEQWMRAVPESRQAVMLEKKIRTNEETVSYMVRIEREFDLIEKKYNLLINQKAIFAQRALARVNFMMQEGMEDTDNVASLIHMVVERPDGDQILEELSENMQFSQSFTQLGEKSMYQKKSGVQRTFQPASVEETTQETSLSAFVPKPLYSHAQLKEFREKNTKDGIFTITEDSITDVEDLEKLMFVWQQVTNEAEQKSGQRIAIGSDLTNGQGYTYSRLTIEEETDD